MKGWVLEPPILLVRTARDQLTVKPTELVTRSKPLALSKDVCAWGQHATAVLLASVTASSPHGGQPEACFSRPANIFFCLPSFLC